MGSWDHSLFTGTLSPSSDGFRKLKTNNPLLPSHCKGLRPKGVFPVISALSQRTCLTLAPQGFQQCLCLLTPEWEAVFRNLGQIYSHGARPSLVHISWTGLTRTPLSYRLFISLFGWNLETWFFSSRASLHAPIFLLTWQCFPSARCLRAISVERVALKVILTHTKNCSMNVTHRCVLYMHLSSTYKSGYMSIVS